VKKTFRFFAMAFLSAASLAHAGAQDKSEAQAPVQPGDLQPAERKASPFSRTATLTCAASVIYMSQANPFRN
jgi:hypothetical protein